MWIWNEIDTRAVVPPASMLTSRDVITPTFTQMADSPCPLGFGIYSCGEDEHDPTQKKPLQMFYVSPAVAADRSLEANPNNACGVMAGWYVTAKPSTEFELRLTTVNDKKLGTEVEKCFLAYLHLDGQYIHDCWVFRDGGLGLVDTIVSGFVEKKTASQTANEKWIRRFSFDKATTVEENDDEEGQSDAGTIRLTVGLGRLMPLPKSGKWCNSKSEWKYCYQDRDVPEKQAEKHGKSLKVSHDSKVRKVTQAPNISGSSSTLTRMLPGATVTVFVREARWLRSRRLIDDHGLPCTLETHNRLHDEAHGKTTEVVDLDSLPGVIDLT